LFIGIRTLFDRVKGFGNATALGIRRAIFPPKRQPSDPDENEATNQIYAKASADGGKGGLQAMRDEVEKMKGCPQWDVDR